MEGQMEIVNISKIRDGFFIGDASSAANIEVIFTFKITHIINCAPTQVPNIFENLGIKYLPLMWTENINHNLFDPKDEISNKIVNFIDESVTVGEGLLINSLKGQNRCCIAVLIFLMKKYRWSLKKSFEYLSSKKQDIDIMKQFFIQLTQFESRLIKNGSRSNEWIEDNFDIGPDEMIMKNTYLNGAYFKQNPSNFIIDQSNKIKTNKKIKWCDNGNNRKEVLCYTNYSKDLLMQKEIKPITIHKKCFPIKSSLKGGNENRRLERTSSNFEKSKNSVNDSKNESVNQSLRSASNDPKGNQGNPNSNIQIITKKIINNNFNNIYITPDMKNLIKMYDEPAQNNTKSLDNLNIQNVKTMVIKKSEGRTNSLNPPPQNQNPLSNSYSKNTMNQVKVSSLSPIGISESSLKISHQKQSSLDFLDKSLKQQITQKQFNEKNLQKSIPSGHNQVNINNYLNQNKNILLKEIQGEIKKSPSTPSIINQNILTKSTGYRNEKQGPIKIQQEESKSLYNQQNIHNISTIKKTNIYTNIGKNQQLLSSSLKPNERPSTAPSKNEDTASQINQQSNQNSASMKRLPSPNIKPSGLLNKNFVSSKYRSPSPALLSSSGKGFGLSSFKSISSKKLR